MFLHNLNLDQQGVLLDLAHQTAQADGEISHLETQMINFLRQQCNPNVTVKSTSRADLASIFDTPIAKYSLLLELLGIAHANNEYHLSEKDIIFKVSQALGVTNDKLQALEAWVEKQFLLTHEVQELLK